MLSVWELQTYFIFRGVLHVRHYTKKLESDYRKTESRSGTFRDFIPHLDSAAETGRL